jgi:hypothetical protein
VGTYIANLGRSPSETADFRPAQFSFSSQPDVRTAKEPSEDGELAEANSTDGKQPAASSFQNQHKARDLLRTLVFEAPMRQLELAKNMYLDYTTT